METGLQIIIILLASILGVMIGALVVINQKLWDIRQELRDLNRTAKNPVTLSPRREIPFL